jgi:hypothetical protein
MAEVTCDDLRGEMWIVFSGVHATHPQKLSRNGDMWSKETKQEGIF